MSPRHQIARFTLVTAAIAAVALGAGGCEGSGSPHADVTPSLPPGEFPLDRYWNALDQSADAQRTQWQVSEEAIAECMMAEGFEYQPAPWEDPAAGASDASDYDTLEYAQTKGFGIVASYLEQADAEPPPESWLTSHLETLDDTQRDAYLLALSGLGAEVAEDLSDDARAAIDPEWGCQEIGQRAAEDVPNTGLSYEEQGKANRDLPPGLLDAEMRLSEALGNDPRVIAAKEDYGHCLADHGYDEVDPSTGLRFEFQMEWSKARGECEICTELIEPDPDWLADFEQREIAAAVAEYECATPYWHTYEQVRHEGEERLIDEYRAELNAWLELYAPQVFE